MLNVGTEFTKTEPLFNLNMTPMVAATVRPQRLPSLPTEACAPVTPAEVQIPNQPAPHQTLRRWQEATVPPPRAMGDGSQIPPRCLSRRGAGRHRPPQAPSHRGVEKDESGDGRAGRLIHYDTEGRIAEVWESLDAQGKPSTRLMHNAGVFTRGEFGADGHGRVDPWLFYHGQGIHPRRVRSER
jgi:hypothetical protein